MYAWTTARPFVSHGAQEVGTWKGNVPQLTIVRRSDFSIREALMGAEPPQTVADLGEFGLIDRVTRGRAQPPGTLLGPGDDAAVVSAPDGRVVASTDVLVEGVHFRLDWSNPEQVGRKAVAVNLADL